MKTQKFSQTQYKNYVFDFLHLTFFHSHFILNFDETYPFFSCKKAYYVKRQDFLENCVSTVYCRHGAGTGTGTETRAGAGAGARTVTYQNLEPGPKIRNIYGSATLLNPNSQGQILVSWLKGHRELSLTSGPA
jgi:hypothetical protein